MEVCGGVSILKGGLGRCLRSRGVVGCIHMTVYSPLLTPIEEHVNLAWTIIKQMNSYFKGNAKHINQYKMQYSFNTPELTTLSFNTKPQHIRNKQKL